MKRRKISLIANSGIQFDKHKVEIDPNADFSKSVRFYEWFDSENFKVKLEYAYYLPADDVWVSKRSLMEEGYLIDGELSDEINLMRLKKLTPGENCFSINDIETPLEYFENRWIPLPFFEVDNSGESVFSSTNWCRLKLIPIDKDDIVKKYHLVVAFDTKTSENKDNIESPSFIGNELSNSYELCNKANLLLDFCRGKDSHGWVDKYIAQIVHGDPDNIPQDFPSFKYLGYYIYFIQYLQKGNYLPSVKLYKDDVDDALNIDMVIDIGNSRTCCLLFDSSDIQNPFSKVRELKLKDLSSPELDYVEPFEMTLAFHKADFGEVKFDDDHFNWPSILRVGKEAQKLIYKSENVSEEGKDKITYHSSPKRYLWDSKQVESQWEFIQLEGTNPNKSVWLNGISQQFNSDGTLCKDGDFGNESSFTRKSLMTFVFLEILAHAYTQINSYEFRKEHGNFSTPRKLRRIVVTCPTAMPKKEQIALRKSAKDASIALNRFYKQSYLEPLRNNNANESNAFEVIPSVSDLKKDLTQLKDRRDWTYDEATCNQLVFLYAEISERYLNKADQFFKLYGKKRTDIEGYDKRSVTIGSIDIGAGTTDLMINSFKYEQSGQAVLTPVPLFWESLTMPVITC